MPTEAIIESRALHEAIPGNATGVACLGVVMPIYNEERTIDEILRRVLAQSVVAEVVAVDDGSTDGSWERLCRWREKDLRVKVLRHERNRGKGAALRTGFQHVQSPIVVVQDADLEYEPADLATMAALILANQADVVYGSRFAGGARGGGPSWHRWGNQLLTRFSNAASHLHLTDEATCYKMFRKELLDRIHLEEDGFGFCPEVTAKVSKMGVRFRELPISCRGRTCAEGKKIRWRDGLHALRCIIKYNWLR
jgi:glycosyltransferase involved in cell wall biosynthesis